MSKKTKALGASASLREPEKQDSKPTLVPKLRFPEFRDAAGWERKKIGSMLIESPRPIELVDDVEYCLVTVKRRYGGLVSRGNLKGKEIKVNNQFLVHGDDFLISKRQIVHDACGLVPEALDGSVVSNEYAVLTPRAGCSIEFFNWFAKQPCVSRSFLECSVGIVIEKMLFKLPSWLKREFLFPPLPEQQKIAECLSSVDELMAAQARKVDALKTHKKWLMQQLFPREGETQPRLRFPEFQNAGDWVSDSLGNLFETTSGGTPSRTEKSYWNGNIPWITTSLVDFRVITSAEEFVTAEGLKNSSAKLFPTGTVLMALYGQGKTRGQVALLDIKAATNQACAAILPRKDIDPYFVFLNLAGRYEEIREMSNSGGQENLSQGLVREIPFAFPQDNAEQRKVTSCLRSLDDLIAAETHKLEALKTHKKGLMQQLFPSPVES
jgi:type I restriction enzyme, S subunit